MSRREIYPLVDAKGLDLVGGKALHLGELLRADFPVPGGFVISTVAYRNGFSETLEQSILNAWQDIGSPRVAVRSSATAEDLEGASMAGQYDTYLNIDTEESLIDSVKKCWASINTERTRAYLAEQDLSPDQVAMAVVVQRQVEADVAGVLFTADPQQAGVDEMLIEASWGLGESVVSGIVQPDLYRIDASNGKLASLVVADKLRWIPAGHAQEEQDVPEEKRKRACLRTRDLHALWKLGQMAAAHYQGPQDIEWAISDGELLMLQARAITTLGPQRARQSVLEKAKARLTQQTGPWVRHNLGETLPHPHPLTWSVIRRFMTGNGGFGHMYRKVGFEPGPTVAEEGFLELIAGEIYMDCARSPEMFFDQYPFSYDSDLLKADPNAAQNPPTLPTGASGERARANKKLINVGARINALAKELSQTLRSKIIPEFEAWYTNEKQRSLPSLSHEELIQCWQEREERIFQKTAPELFLPSLVEGHLQQVLRAQLAEVCWDRDPDELLQILSVADEPDATMRSNQDLEQVAKGALALEEWILRYGHRCPGEFDFATPRWRERPADAAKLAEVLKKGGDTQQLHHQRLKESSDELQRVLSNCPASERESLQALVADYKTYLPFREDAKDAIIRGCDLLRDIALECGQRLGIGEKVFWLNEAELFQSLRTGYIPEDIISERSSRHAAEATIETPFLILPEQLPALGHSSDAELPQGDRLPALTLSRGVATGTVCIVRSPEEVGELADNYVLVCPSTDPSWTPLFVNAVAVVLERGGALSHGAVVAREMGVPAVVLPNATRILQMGEEISIDGDRGAVIRASAEKTTDSAAAEISIDPQDCYFPPEMIPPPPGRKERKAGQWALWSSVFWGVFLGLVFLLPPKILHDPVMHLMDTLLWPLVNAWGRAGALAIIAVSISCLLIALQRFLTDNDRMLAVRDRSAQLRNAVKTLAPDAPRRKRAEQLAKPSTLRAFIAAMVPIALILGPLCLLFTWFPLRLVPTAQNAPAGSSVTVVATLDGEWQTPIQLQLDDPRLTLELGESLQSLPPIRPTLENLKAEWMRDSGLAEYPWAIKAAALHTREAMLTDLTAYLQRGIPPQSLIWTVQANEGTEGSFPFSLRAADLEPISGTIRLGESLPPVAAYDEILTDTAVQKVQIVYPPNPKKAVFWSPFAALGWGWDFGWLLTYLLAYLPPMFLMKKLLNVA